MNLLETMRGEIVHYNLTDKLEMAYYLYIRTGQLFVYNPAYKFMTPKEKEQEIVKRIDIQNVTDFNIVCFSWAYLYVDLLHAFGIDASVKEYCEDDNCEDIKKHAYVEITIEDKKYEIDLTSNFGEISIIKAGLKPSNFKEISVGGGVPSSNQDPLDRLYQVFCEKGICSIEFLKSMIRIKNFLQSQDFSKINDVSDEKTQELIYWVYRAIAQLINHPAKSYDYVSGKRMIYYLLQEFLGTDFKANYTHFYNKEKTNFIEVYSLIRNGEPCYFAYQKYSTGYELQEVPKEYVECLVSSYVMHHINDMVLLSKPISNVDLILMEQNQKNI